MELYLIRHAQSQNNARPEADRVQDPGITDIGRQQCEKLAAWIPQLKLDVLVTSPFLRTLETAHHIVQTTGLKPKVRIDLHELGGCVSGAPPATMVGEAGMCRNQIEDNFPGFEVHDEISDSGWWGGKPYETHELANARAERLLSATMCEFGDTQLRIGYVTHGDFKRIFVNQFHDEWFASPWNTSVTSVRIQGQQASLMRFNQVDHLDDSLLTR